MSRVFAICNQKGGVGKTTTAVNLSAALGAAGYKVLLVDLDPQGNASTGSGLSNKRDLELSVADVLFGNASLTEACQATGYQGFTLLPANETLTQLEVQLLQEVQREYRLREALSNCTHDFVLIDCPPALNILTVNALVAADKIIVPAQCEFYALEGLDALMGTIERVRGAANADLSIAGILRTMYDSRNNLAYEVSQTLLKHFGEKVYRTLIPRNVALAEAPSHHRPVMYYQRSSRGAAAYFALAGELLRREELAVGAAA